MVNFNRNKKTSRGGALVLVLGTLAAIAGIIVILVMWVMGLYNSSVRSENALTAQYLENQNVYTSYSQKLMQAAQVPTMMRDDVMKVTKAAIEGRYGQDGSRAVFQMLREQNPTLSEGLYKEVQSIIVSGRNEFAAAQKLLTDKARVYKNDLQTMPGGFVRGLMGFPRVDMEKFKPIITDNVETIYKTGKEPSDIQLRPAGQ